MSTFRKRLPHQTVNTWSPKDRAAYDKQWTRRRNNDWKLNRNLPRGEHKVCCLYCGRRVKNQIFDNHIDTCVRMEWRVEGGYTLAGFGGTL